MNLLKQKKKNDAKNESYTDSDDGEQLRNFVAFTTLESVLRQNLQ